VYFSALLSKFNASNTACNSQNVVIFKLIICPEQSVKKAIYPVRVNT